MSLSRFKTESRRTLHLAFPIIVGNLGQTVITFTDTLMVGRLGAAPLAAAGFAGNLLFVFVLFGIGLLAPAAALVAKHFGRRESEEISQTLKSTVALATIVSWVLMIFLWAATPLLKHMGQSAEVAEQATPFFMILVASLWPSLLYQAYKQFTDGLAHPRFGMFAVLTAVVLNVIGNALLIYGFGPIPALGLEGSAIATLFCRWLMAVIMIVVVHKGPLFRKYSQNFFAHLLRVSHLKSLFVLGLPNGLTYVFEVGAFTLSSVMMGWLGAPSLAAHQIALNLASISFLVTVGIGVAASIRVGYELGLNKVDDARYAGRTALWLGAGYMLLSASAVFLTRDLLPRVYTSDFAVIGLATSYLAIASAFQFFDGIQAVAIGALRGLQDTRWPSILAFIAYWVVGLPVSYYLGFTLHMAGQGIWWGLFTGLMLTAIFLTVRFELRFRRVMDS